MRRVYAILDLLLLHRLCGAELTGAETDLRVRMLLFLGLGFWDPGPLQGQAGACGRGFLVSMALAMS